MKYEVVRPVNVILTQVQLVIFFITLGGRLHPRDGCNRLCSNGCMVCSYIYTP